MDSRQSATPALRHEEQVIDEELARITAAVELVAARPTFRVTLTGLRFGESLLPRLQLLARSRGVRIRPVWPMGDGPVDLVVEGTHA